MEFEELNDRKDSNRDVKIFNSIHGDDSGINLCINYQIFEKNIIFNYTSKEGILEIMLNHLHSLFIEELSLILKPENEKFDKKSFLKVDDTTEEKLYKIQVAQTALYMKNSGIFDEISVDDIMKLAECCRLKTYLSGDDIVSEKSTISKLYIIGDGKIEESRMALDGMVKSLRIVKKGCIFGVESLFADRKAKTTYTVVSSQAEIVEIDREILEAVLRKKPKSLIALLEKEYEQKCRFQQLWMTV